MPSLQNVATTTVTLTLPFIDAVNMTPIAGVTVQACAKLDVTCAAPVSKVFTSDGQGYVRVPVMGGFDGYLKTTWSEAPPTLTFINPPATSSAPRNEIDLLSTFDFQVIGSETIDGGLTDKSLGVIFSNVADCNGNNAEGVSFSLDNAGPKTLPVYIINGLPTPTAKQTDSSGNFVEVNVPPGNVTLTATVAATGQRIGVATGFVRASTFSYILLVPSP